MRYWRYWLGRHLIHLGLWVMPPGQVKRELTDNFRLWGVDLVAAVAWHRATGE